MYLIIVRNDTSMYYLCDRYEFRPKLVRPKSMWVLRLFDQLYHTGYWSDCKSDCRLDCNLLLARNKAAYLCYNYFCTDRPSLASRFISHFINNPVRIPFRWFPANISPFESFAANNYSSSTKADTGEGFEIRLNRLCRYSKEHPSTIG